MAAYVIVDVDVLNRVVILEFESAEAARAWYRSPEYREAMALRHRASRGNLILVDGV